MHFETRLIAAEDDEYAAVGESAQPLNEWSGIELPGFDTVRLATLHALLTGDSLQQALDQYEPVYVSADETVVLRVADELFEALAGLDEDAVLSVADELVATEEFESTGWSAEEVVDLLSAISELAQLAESQEQVLFLAIRPDEVPEE